MWICRSNGTVMSLLTSCFNGVSLQNEVSVLSPRVAFLDQQRTILTVGNSHLKQRIAALAQDKIFKDGQCSTRDSQLTPFLSPFQGFRKHHSREITKHSVFPCSSSRGAQGGDREAPAGVPAAEPQDVLRRGLGRAARPRRAASRAPGEGAHELIEPWPASPSCSVFRAVRRHPLRLIIDPAGGKHGIDHACVGARNCGCFPDFSFFLFIDLCVSFFACLVSVLVSYRWKLVKKNSKVYIEL
jgi:hypothetical protein